MEGLKFLYTKVLSLNFYHRSSTGHCLRGWETCGQMLIPPLGLIRLLNLGFLLPKACYDNWSIESKGIPPGLLRLFPWDLAEVVCRFSLYLDFLQAPFVDTQAPLVQTEESGCWSQGSGSLLVKGQVWCWWLCLWGKISSFEQEGFGSPLVQQNIWFENCILRLINVLLI